jgi:RNA polymerase sigma factor (sigma-70 family)
LSTIDPDANTRQTCRRVVQRLIRQHEWKLAKEDDLIERVLESTMPEASSAELEKLTLRAYAIVLHEACRQTANFKRQEQAYLEVHRYLFRLAYKMWPGLDEDVFEDIVQGALCHLFEQLNLDKCKQPAAYFHYLKLLLLWAARDELRQLSRRKTETSLEQEDSSEPELQILDSIPDDRSLTDPQWQTSYREQWEVLAVAIQRLPDARMREVILGKFFGGLKDQEIGDRLGVTANYVRVIRHEAMTLLRKDEHLRGYFKGADSEKARRKGEQL